MRLVLKIIPVSVLHVPRERVFVDAAVFRVGEARQSSVGLGVLQDERALRLPGQHTANPTEILVGMTPTLVFHALVMASLFLR